MTDRLTEKKLSNGFSVLRLPDGECIYTMTLPTGDFLAYRDPEEKVEGWGHTRLAAIIDFIEQSSGFDARFIYDLEKIVVED